MQIRRKDDREIRPINSFIKPRRITRGMNIYIGNLSRDVTEDDLRVAFSVYGKISGVKVIKDKFSGEPKGFGFVEMPVFKEARTAISNLNGTLLKGQELKVTEAHSNSNNHNNNGNGNSLL